MVDDDSDKRIASPRFAYRAARTIAVGLASCAPIIFADLTPFAVQIAGTVSGFAGPESADLTLRTIGVLTAEDGIDRTDNCPSFNPFGAVVEASVAAPVGVAELVVEGDRIEIIFVAVSGDIEGG